jgi:hypothetical protein
VKITIQFGNRRNSSEKYQGVAGSNIEHVERMFDVRVGYGNLTKPTAEVVALVAEATKETAEFRRLKHEESKRAGEALRGRCFLLRWFTRTPEIPAALTEKEVCEVYRVRFKTLLEEIREKNIRSHLSFGKMNCQIAACEAVVRELGKV